MDRVTTYTLALGRSTDFLQAQQNSMVGNAYSNQLVLGGGVTTVDGLALTQTTVASLVLNLGLGAIYAPANLEASTWSVLPANGTIITKQGLLQTVDPITFTPPATTGYSQNFLVQVQYADLDTLPVLLPFYNAATPSTPYQGPNNSGASSPTVRQGIVSVNVKAGTAANTGSQTTPTPDSGWTGLYVVTVPNGATQLTSGNIAVYSGAPFLLVRLPGVPAGVQSNRWAAALDTSATANALRVPLVPVPATIPFGMFVTTKVLTTNTGPTTMDVGTGALAVIYPGGSPLLGGEFFAGRTVDMVFNGSAWEWQGQQAPILQQSTTIYVNGTTGSNSNNGLTSATAFQTIQYALAYVATLNFNGKTLTIQVADGAYTGNLIWNTQVNGQLILQGNVTTPANCTITVNSGTNASVLYVSFGAAITIQGFKIANAQAGYHGLQGYAQANISYKAIDFGVIASGSHILGEACNFHITGTYYISGGAYAHWSLSNCSLDNPLSGTNNINLVNTNMAITIFLNMTDGYFRVTSAYTGVSGAGSTTGCQKYNLSANAVAITAGLVLPGGTAGTMASGGYYS